jgi:hypothetical protein
VFLRLADCQIFILDTSDTCQGVVDKVVITALTLNQLLLFRIGSSACASEKSSTYDDIN